MPPPQKPKTEEYYEHDYAIRRLTEAVDVLTQQVEKNANECRVNRESLLVLNTKWMMLACFSGACGALVTALLKLFIH